MNKIIFDIGTHRYEELKFLFGNTNEKYFFYIFWIKSSLLSILRNKNINEFGYTRSFFNFKLSDHLSILKLLFIKKNSRYPFKIICIDPNFMSTMKKNFESKFLSFFNLNLAIGESDKDTIYLKKLYLGNSTLSSNIYEENTNDKKYKLVPCTSFNNLLKILIQKKIIDIHDQFIIRMNCEGSEFFIIRDIIKNDLSISLIFGSLNDVRKKHGEKEYDQMIDLINEKKIDYIYFKASDPSSWLNAKLFFLDKYICK